jgi:hypothetical protein
MIPALAFLIVHQDSWRSVAIEPDGTNLEAQGERDFAVHKGFIAPPLGHFTIRLQFLGVLASAAKRFSRIRPSKV